MENNGKNFPEKLKLALSDHENFKKCCQIAEAFGIYGDGEGADILDNIFEKTTTGNLPLEKVPNEIQEKLKISQEVAERIAKEMDNQIFSNYKEELNNLYKSYTKEETKIFPDSNFSKEEKKENIISGSSSTLIETGNSKNKDVDDLLEKLSLELKKEKEERKKLDNKLKEHIS